MPEATVAFIAYRVSVTVSAARAYAADAAAVARETARLSVRGGADRYDRLVPEIEAQAARAAAAAARADAAWQACLAVGAAGRGPVVLVEDGSRRTWREDAETRRTVRRCATEAIDASGEAHVALEIAQALAAVVTRLAS